MQHIVQRRSYFSPATPIIAVTQYSDKYSFIFADTSCLISLILFYFDITLVQLFEKKPKPSDKIFVSFRHCGPSDA